jgi:peptide/nickel transport system substrate-binding protein
MRKRKLMTVSIVLLLVTAIVLSGCNQPTQTAQPGTQTPAADKVFYGAWPYSMPPKGHFNEFATDNMLNSSPYQKVMYQPLAIHETVKDNWIPILATEWKIDNDKNTVTVKLRDGVKWSDGSEFTSKDVVDTMIIDKARNLTVWSYLTKVEAIDKNTVVYTLSNPSTIALRYILSTSPKPSSLYGKFADELKALFDAGKDNKSDEVRQVMNDKVTPFRPEKPVVTGAYMIDPATITDAQLTMVKNPNAWNADKSKFDKIVIYCGETEAITPLVLQKKIDFATHAFPVATDQQRYPLPVLYRSGSLL